MCTASTHNTNVLLNYVVIYYTVVNSWEVVPFAILCFSFLFLFIFSVTYWLGTSDLLLDYLAACFVNTHILLY